MNIRKTICDHCKKEIDTNVTVHNVYNEGGIVDPYESHTIDLCPECTNKFREWVGKEKLDIELFNRKR